LNVNVQEFYPRDIQSKDEEKDQETPKTDVPAKATNDLQNQSVPKMKGEMLTKNKTSHTSKISNGRVTKREIIDGIKSMEQQNINLISTSKNQINPINNNKVDDDWNIIKNGKKIKVLKDTDDGHLNSNNFEEIKVGNVVEVNAEIVKEEAKPIIIPLEKTNSSIKKTTQQPQLSKSMPQAANNSKSKKNVKGKNKKKKSHLMTKQQDGFEIIEPEFGNNSNENKKSEEEEEDEEAINETIEEDVDSATEYSIENVLDTNVECVISNVVTVNECENLNIVKELELEPVKEIEEEEIILKVLNVQASQSPENNKSKDVDDVIDISDEEISSRTSIEIDLSIAQEIAEIEKEDEKQGDENKSNDVFDDINFFENRKNIAELERDLMENLRILDDGIDIKSPIINPLFDFPITSAVQKWLQEKQNESFECLFRIENFKKLSELYDDCEDDESDISDSPVKSEATDSDYASDIQIKVNGSPASSNAKIDTKITSNNKIIVKESFCALM